MKNLNELHRTENTDGEVVAFEGRKPQPENPRPLLPGDPVEELHTRWDAIQTGFIDDPRMAVKDADSLVESAMKQISAAFAGKREHLRQQWDRGDQVSTEDLRLALQQYRAVFARLKSMVAESQEVEDRA